MRKIARLLFALIFFLPAAGCWIPEQFDAKIAIHSDGSYTYSYDGILTFALALAESARKDFDAKAEAELKKFEIDFKNYGFQKAEHLGRGRYSVAFERTSAKGQASYFLNKDMAFFKIEPRDDGTLVISAVRPTEKGLRQINEIGAKIDGTINASVDRGVTVLKHNADSEPKFYGLFGAYKWTIKSPAAEPFMVVRPAT